jgi:hypothetical protein
MNTLIAEEYSFSFQNRVRKFNFFKAIKRCKKDWGPARRSDSFSRVGYFKTGNYCSIYSWGKEMADGWRAGKSINFEHSENLFILGDHRKALKCSALSTGMEFVYSDR